MIIKGKSRLLNPLMIIEIIAQVCGFLLFLYQGLDR